MKKAIIALLLVLSFVPMTYAIFGVSGTVYADGVGRYLWRGQVLDDGISIQPGISISLNKISLDWWGSYSAVTNELIESDYRISASDSLPFLPISSLEAGFWVYTMPYFPADGNHSIEVYTSLSFDVPTQPYISYYYGGLDFPNGYAELGFSHDQELFGFGINGSVNIGYNFGQDNYMTEDAAKCTPSFTAVSGTIGLSYSFAGLKISPAFTGQIALDSQYLSLGTWKVSVSYDFGGEDELPLDGSKGE